MVRLIASIAAVLAMAATGLASPFYARQAPTLDAAIKAEGREYVGTALTIRDDAAEQGIIVAEYGGVTPENAMKWESTEPTQGNFTFEAADEVADFAAANDMHLRCHTLVWYSQLPDWVSQIESNETLLAVVENHISTVVGRYKGVCNHWDVVNEALNENGTYRDNVFLRVIGEAYIPIAFRLAAAADPEAQLYYNDYNLEYGEAKAEGAARLVRLVQSYGVRIDGVGLQAHLTSGATPTNAVTTPAQDVLEGTLKLYTDLGVDVAYTEIDIRLTTPPTEEQLRDQAAAWRRVAGSCLATARCVGMTTWGVSDKYSWIPGVFEGEGAALLWDDNYQKKPAYTGFLDGISDAGSGNGTAFARRSL